MYSVETFLSSDICKKEKKSNECLTILSLIFAQKNILSLILYTYV